jgi:hypothetical protein
VITGGVESEVASLNSENERGGLSPFKLRSKLRLTDDDKESSKDGQSDR